MTSVTNRACFFCCVLSAVVLTSIYIYNAKSRAENVYFINHSNSNPNFKDLSFTERRAIVARRCRDVKMWPEHRHEANASAKATAFVDNTYQLVACNNHKVGTSTLTRILYKLRNNTKLNETLWRYNFSKELEATQINSLPYLRFMFVRDPLERLLSAYTDNKGVPFIKGEKVSFNEFLRQILNRSRPDTHHMRYYRRCRPCDVHYDFFGTMDTYNDDLTYIFDRLHVPFDSIPRLRGGRTTRYTSDERLIHLPLSIKVAVWQHFKEDYYIFGYQHPAVMYREPNKNHTDSMSKTAD